MSFWNKLGKIALTVAPYVAAPFTGGASLAATGLANKAVQKWSQSDANKAMAKGLAPSKFDSVLGKVGNIASTASMFVPGGQLGALGKAGSVGSKIAGGAQKLSTFQKIMSGVSDATGGSYNPNSDGGQYGNDLPSQGGISGNMGRGGYGGFGGTPGIVSTQKPSSWQDMLGSILDKYGQSQHNPQPTQDDYGSGGGGSYGGYGGGGGYGSGGGQDRGRSRFGRQMRRELGPIMGQTDQNFPNLAESIGAGRMEAIRNQPWRGGYDINTVGPNDEEGNPTVVTSNMPPVYPTGRRRGSRFTYASQ